MTMSQGSSSRRRCRRISTRGAIKATIAAIDFAEAVKRKGKATIVDVRSGAEREEGKVSGSVHAPYTRLSEYVDEVPAEGELLVHCGSGARAAVAAAYLARTGRNVTVIDDLFENYKGG
jgi:hydroxyacylglutathione hydrolase